MKKDIKYIIKRVIITLLIIFIVGNLKQCKVFADANTNYINIASNGSNLSLSSTRVSGSSIIEELSIYNKNVVLTSTITTDNSYYILFYNSNTNDYILYFFSASNDFITNSNNYGLLYTNISNGYFQQPNIFSIDNSIPYSQLNNYNITDKYSNLSSYINYQRYNLYKISLSGDTLVMYTNYNVQSNENYEIISTNIGKNLLKVKNNISYYFYEYDELANYSKIDLTGTQSVYFVPKNYNNVPLEQLDDNGTTYSVINFDYYFTGSIKEGFFPLDNPDTPVFTWWENNSSYPEFIDSFFPIYENYQDESGYQYYSYMIYNNYKDSSIWYDANIFDAYLVNDMTNYDETISFIDRNDQEIEKNIKFTKSIQQIWEQGFEKGGENFINGEFFTGNIEGYFLIVKAPFDFFNDLLDDSITCQPIDIPIPFLNSEIHLDCLSSFFQSILGNFYNILFILLNSLLAYRITIRNLDTITDVLNPDDDKLEVINL